MSEWLDPHHHLESLVSEALKEQCLKEPQENTSGNFRPFRQVAASWAFHTYL